MIFLSIYVNLSKITMCTGVFISSGFYYWSEMGGYSLEVTMGVKGVYCSLWELLVDSCLQ